MVQMDMILSGGSGSGITGHVMNVAFKGRDSAGALKEIASPNAIIAAGSAGRSGEVVKATVGIGGGRGGAKRRLKKCGKIARKAARGPVRKGGRRGKRGR